MWCSTPVYLVFSLNASQGNAQRTGFLTSSFQGISPCLVVLVVLVPVLILLCVGSFRNRRRFPVDPGMLLVFTFVVFRHARYTISNSIVSDLPPCQVLK